MFAGKSFVELFVFILKSIRMDLCICYLVMEYAISTLAEHVLCI